MSDKFDLKVHHIDQKTKRVTRSNPYRLHVCDGAQIFERPPGSGKFYDGQGQEIEDAPEIIKSNAVPPKPLKAKPKLKHEGK